MIYTFQITHVFGPIQISELLLWVCPFGRASPITIYRIYRGVQIENDVKWQTRADDVVVEHPERKVKTQALCLLGLQIDSLR